METVYNPSKIGGDCKNQLGNKPLKMNLSGGDHVKLFATENVFQKLKTGFSLECVFCYFKSGDSVIWLLQKLERKSMSYLESGEVTCIIYLKAKRHVHF